MKLLQFTLITGVMAIALCGNRNGFAQTSDFVVSTFDTEESAFAWSRWWGAAGQTYEFDPSIDAANSPESGSLKATIDFDLAAYGGDNQFALLGAFPDNAVLDGTQYTNLVFDLRWDSSSPKRPSGDFGNLEYGFRKTDWGQIWLPPSLNVPATPVDDWIRVSVPISPAAAGIDQINGVVLKLWSGDANSGLTGITTFWIDNVTLIGNPTTEVPRPTLSLEKTEPGLRIFASGSGEYQRQNIRTTEGEYSWIGAGQPVTYSFTITDYPDATLPGFQTHLFLVPGFGLPTFESAPDWNRPHVIFLDVQNNAQGGAYATFRYKVNAENSNSMIYNSNPDNGPVGTLGGVGSSTIIGTWSLTFTSDTTAVVTTPDGNSATFELPAEDAAPFSDSLYAFFGIQPNGVAKIGHSAAFSEVKITGVAIPIEEDFAGVAPFEGEPVDLDPLIWTRVAENAPGIVLVPGDATYELSWTVPAAGFVAQSSTDLVTWNDLDNPATQIGNRVRSILTTLPDPRTAFFRLVRP